MSIATGEALEWHGLHGDEPGDRDSTYSAGELDEAYIAGRTAEPSETGIDAAAKEFYAHLSGNIFHGALDDDGAPMLDADPFHDVFIDATKAALFASRKAVSE